MSPESLSWTFLIAGILTVSTVIDMFSWKRPQLRKRLRAVLQSSGRMSICDTILAAMGFDDQLFSRRIDSSYIRVLHVLGKAGCGMVCLAEVTRRVSHFRRSSNKSSDTGALQWVETDGRETQFVTLKKILPEL